MKKVQWEMMFPDELEQAFQAAPLVYFTYGLCEPHGPQNALGLDVSVEDVSDRVAALSLQGPLSRAVLECASGTSFGALRYFRLAGTHIAGLPVTVTRTIDCATPIEPMWVHGKRCVAEPEVVLSPTELAEQVCAAFDQPYEPH